MNSTDRWPYLDTFGQDSWVPALFLDYLGPGILDDADSCLPELVREKQPLNRVSQLYALR